MQLSLANILSRTYLKCLFGAILTLSSLSAISVPSQRLKMRLTLTDGTQVMATRVGNEDFAFFLTDEGLVVSHTPQGYELTPWTAEEYATIHQSRPVSTLARERRRIGSRENSSLSSIGTQHIPLILVSFADLDFTVGKTDEAVREYYDKYCNGTRDGQAYTAHGSYGSIRDYFIEQSDSLFFPEFDIIGPVKLDEGYAYYGQNRGDDDHDIYFTTFRVHAISKAMQLNVDWDKYDNNSNGDIDMVYFVYAGLGENSSNDENTIWPKESTFPVKAAGKTFATSAACNELMPSKWNDDQTQILATKPDGIGVFIHELSHALGLPDFYDTNNIAFGMDYWSIMDYGEYGGNGYYPCNYTAYERDFMGWRPLVTLEDPCTLRIPCFAEGGTGYKVINKSNPDEYYILENRQAKGWDERICRRGHGLQVTHVDYNKYRWENNTVNTDPQHQRMTIIAANNRYVGTNEAETNQEWFETLAGNLYPGNTFNYDLTDDSYPAATVYTGKYMRQPIRDISEEADGTVTLKFCPLGTLESPTDLTVDNLGETEFTLRWEAVPNATCYRVQIRQGDEVFTQLENLEGTEYHFTNLQPETEYTARVMAQSDVYLNSLYQETIISTLATSIRPVTLSPSETLVRVYALNGSFVTECYHDEIKRLALRRGIYVIRSSGGKTQKILIK